MYIMSSDNCKKIDNEAIEGIKIPGILLMENAANEVFINIKDKGDSFVVISGTGNNGGDGLAVGRKLLLDGKKVSFVIVNPNENYSNDFNVNLNIITNITDNIYYIKEFNDIEKVRELNKNSDVIIDSIFGVGLNRDLNSFYFQLVECVNESKKIIVAIDVPSGLDCNTGKILGNAVKATYTYTFEVIKRGFINYSAFEYLGNLKVLSIGMPNKVKDNNSEGIIILDKNQYKAMINKRKSYGHKGSYGKAIIFAGSIGFTGASYIVTEACIKAGAGLTTLVTATECQKIVASQLIEAMTANYSEKDRIIKNLSTANAIAFGPGIKDVKEYEDILLWVIQNSTANIVIDAEGINILSRRPDIINNLRGRGILTPHPGEMSRLINKPIKEIEEKRIEIAKEFAMKYDCVLLLKGFNTVITDGNKVYINPTGDSKMANGGMGDCLTGIITSLVAQGYNIFDAATLGAYIHGLAAENEGENKYSVVATDVINRIQNTMNELIIN